MVINKKLMRSSRSVKLRMVGVIAIIAFSAALMVSFQFSMKSVAAQLEVFRNESSLHDVLLETQKPIDENEKLENAVIEKRYTFDADLSDGKLLHISSLTSYIDIALVLEGNTISKSGELLIDGMFSKSNGIAVGDSIEICGKSFAVCGFYTAPDTVLPAKNAESIMVSSDSFGLAVMSAEDIKNLGECGTEYIIKVSNALQINNIIGAINEKYGITACKKLAEDNRATYIDGDLKLFSGDFQILPAIFMLIAAFACSAVISRIMKAEAVQMGVLYAMGYRRRTLYLHYMRYPLVIALAGIVLGCIMGITLTPSIAGILDSRYLLPRFEMTVYAKPLIIAAILPTCFIFVICSLSIMLMLRQTPLELIKNEKKSAKISAFSHVKLNGLSFGKRFTLRTLFRNIPRELFLVLGTALSALLMLIYVSMISSLSGVLNASFNDILKYEYMYTFSSPQTVQYEEVCYINSISVLLDGDYVDLNGVSDEFSMMNYSNPDGSKTDFSKNIITNNIAMKYGINEGDKLSLKNSHTDEIYEITIDTVCVSYVENFIAVSLDRFNEMTGQAEGAYVILASNDKLEIADESVLQSLETIEANRKAVSETIRPLYVLFGILLAMAVVAAFIIMAIITSVIIEENRHTISLMKVFGYKERRIASLVIDLNAIAAVIGYILAVPLTLRLSEKVFAFMSDTLGMYIPAKLSISLCMVGFVFIMLIFFAAKAVMQRKIFAASAAEAIKAKE